jgi:ABC-type dipeptide/oligopeptide/nickel transport system permease subunit
LGAAAGYYDRLGFAIMRVVDIFLAVPRFPLIVFLAAFLKPGLWTFVLIFSLLGWARTSRLVRSRVLSERTSGYVQAARMVGARDMRVIFRHLLPSAVPIALSRFVVDFQHMILAESGLCFLGLGDPANKSWGMMLHYAFQYPTIFISDVWVWWALPPGVCITLVVLALTFSGFSLEERANPRLRTLRQHSRIEAPAEQRELPDTADSMRPSTKAFVPGR